MYFFFQLFFVRLF
uniref:Uncharacterized protein n=1 Tax=Anguilla anguilla TaxID=7936 RepID=A0A0E9VML6_ANGAN